MDTLDLVLFWCGCFVLALLLFLACCCFRTRQEMKEDGEEETEDVPRPTFGDYALANI